MNSVPTPAACACATIAAMLPPFDWLTYQIHIPWPSSGLGPTAPTCAGVTGTGVGFGRGGRRPYLTIEIGP